MVSKVVVGSRALCVVVKCKCFVFFQASGGVGRFVWRQNGVPDRSCETSEHDTGLPLYFPFSLPLLLLLTLSLGLSSFFLLLCSCLASLCSSLENTAVPVHTNTKQPSLIIQTFYTCLYCKSTTQMHYRIKENDKYYVGYSCNKYRKCIFVTKNNEP